MEDAQACASDYSTVLSDHVQMAVGVSKHTPQGFSCEDDVAGELLHQDREIVEVGFGIG